MGGNNSLHLNTESIFLPCSFLVRRCISAKQGWTQKAVDFRCKGTRRPSRLQGDTTQTGRDFVVIKIQRGRGCHRCAVIIAQSTWKVTQSLTCPSDSEDPMERHLVQCSSHAAAALCPGDAPSALGYLARCSCLLLGGPSRSAAPYLVPIRCLEDLDEESSSLA